MTLKELKKYLPGVQGGISFKNHTTFHIGGKARFFFNAGDKDDLLLAVNAAKKFNLPFFVLGGGSNLLVSDKGFNGLVIKIRDTRHKTQDTKITAGAGIFLDKLINIALENGLTGLEWSKGVPGTLGGAVRGNAGAFGTCMQDIVESVEALDAKSLKIKNYNLRNCEFSYRTSAFKKDKNLIVFSATLKLKKDSRKNIAEKIEYYSNYRKTRHPKGYSAGSIFKNLEVSKNRFQSLQKKFPEISQFKERGNVPVAFLISECGLKGRKIGGAKISEKHPNFILNFKEAKAKDVKKMINLAKKEVKKKFGLSLEEEIRYL